jgi:hypothetical protein
MNNADLVTRLEEYDACREAIEWIGSRDLQSCWRDCERGDWMLWLAATAGVDRKAVVAAACDVARTALGRVPAGDLRPLLAIETAEAWTQGTATIEDVREAADAAAAAAAAAEYAAAAAAAAYAAGAAAYAAYAVDAVDAVDAAYAATYAAYAASADCPLRKLADIVRKRIPLAVICDAMEMEAVHQ